MIKIINVYKDSRVMEMTTSSNLGLGVKTDNDVDLLRFTFDDFIVGTATLLTTLTDSNGELVAFPLTINQEEKSYDLEVTQYVASELNYTIQIEIVNDDMVWHSKQADITLDECLEIGEGEMPTTIENWLQNANIVLSEMEQATRETENLNIEVGTETSTTIPVTFTDKEGNQTTVNVKGARGEKGEQGIQGLRGEKGDKGDKGEQGEQGDDYVLTAQDKEEIAGMVDVPVDDVQINGTSVVQDGVANVPIASADELGAVKINAISRGIGINSSGVLGVYAAGNGTIKNGSNGYLPIVPQYQHASVFYGLAKAAGDTTQSQSSNAVGNYTEDAKVAIQKMLGIYREWELIADTTIDEDSIQVDITTDLNGQAFELSEMFVRVWLKPSTTGANDYISSKGLVTFSNNDTNTTSFPTLRYMASGAQTFMEFKAELIDGVSFVMGSGRANPNTTNALQTISGETGNIKYYHGFRIGRYSSAMSLIPAGTRITVRGIRV